MKEPAPFKRLVTHANCADGLASAMIVDAALPGIEIVFANYNTPELDNLRASEGLLFCDMTPPRSRVEEFVAAGATVLDHHLHARDIVEAFGERGVFSDEPGVSGATLAYRHVFEPRRGRWLDGESFARIIGVRDTWQTESAEWPAACALSAALLHMPRMHWFPASKTPAPIARALSEEMFGLGHILMLERRVDAKEIARDGTILFEDYKGRVWHCFPDGRRLVSDAAEELRRQGHPLACGWFQDVKDGLLRTTLSLRSDGSVDVGAICKAAGGGGHARAAGCTVNVGDPRTALTMVLGARLTA